MASRRIGFQRPARPYARTVREGAEARAGERTEAQRQQPLSHMHAHLTAHSFSRFPHHTQLVLQLLRQPTQPPTNQERGSCYRNKEWNHITQKQHEKVRSLSLSQVKGGASAADAVILGLQQHHKIDHFCNCMQRCEVNSTAEMQQCPRTEGARGSRSVGVGQNRHLAAELAQFYCSFRVLLITSQ